MTYKPDHPFPVWCAVGTGKVDLATAGTARKTELPMFRNGPFASGTRIVYLKPKWPETRSPRNLG
jgi:hypothetical protein